jgi:protein dithiol oxidoreductase (disulfide-forming)
MRLRHLALSFGLALTLAACGKQESAVQRSPAITPPPPVAAQTRAAASQQKPSEQASDLPSKITRMNEDGSETVEEVTGDSGAHNPILAAVALTVASSISTASAATSTTAPTLWQEGVNYTRIVPAQPTSVAAGQVEVLEFFWYACPHCYEIEPLVEKWNKTKPAYISFSRVHVMWSESHRSLARLYYTLENMGKLDQMHGEIFKAIHVSGNALVANDPTDTNETERIQSLFVKKFGISEDDFRKAYHSLPVDLALQKADQLMERYRIDAVPTFVINGKFVADVHTADGAERLMSLVTDLAAQEHKR